MKRCFIISALMMVNIIMQGCNNVIKKGKADDGLKALEWLTGNWSFTTGDSIVFGETWERANDSVFTGQGSGIKQEDTLFFEQLSIRQEGDSIFYVPVVSGQNEGKEVKFLLNRSSETEFVFENPAHDFPQTISYYHKGVFPDDTLYAAISGKQDGQERKEEFLFFRVK